MAPPKTDAVSDQGVLTRAVGIIFSPGQTFQAVVRSPQPAGILLLVCLVTSLFVGMPQFTERGRQALLDMQAQQIERLTGNPITPDAYAALERRAPYAGYLTVAFTFLFLPVFSVALAGLFFVIFNALLGGTATFKQVLAIVTHAQVIGALGAVLSAPIQFFQGAQTAAGPFNLGVLVPMLEPGGIVASILGAISLFSVWLVCVSAIGLAVLYKRRAGGIIVALLGGYLLLVSGFTVFVSRMLAR